MSDQYIKVWTNKKGEFHLGTFSTIHDLALHPYFEGQQIFVGRELHEDEIQPAVEQARAQHRNRLLRAEARRLTAKIKTAKTIRKM